MTTMTLEQLRSALLEEKTWSRGVGWPMAAQKLQEWADVIQAHLAQPAQAVCVTYKRVGWITETAVMGLLQTKGFSKRNTVPVHAEEKRFARVPVYVDIADKAMSAYLRDVVLHPEKESDPFARVNRIFGKLP